MAKIQARVPDAIQERANAVIKSNGLTVSDVVRMFMTRVAEDKTLPPDLFQPHTETRRTAPDAQAWREFFELLQTLNAPDDFMSERPLNTLARERGVFDDEMPAPLPARS
jgi:DNA-damage-inducible protein J